ncbi:hypothetical protein SUGI_0144200 [Cryptomeria japonica]|uniref:small ribosomal subunit protein eS30z/eS30y/eS30x n=1 Tax=Cryptomeria japonica TaxID=3369 RepID=UPI002408A010|nr:small ribosomal subunit protein eS30z/eS30y/eS30x [Cryptomeria japonica]GLJ11137.1 hypothetical protein SUGI_0144200 [Cryptomeria japonica]
MTKPHPRVEKEKPILSKGIHQYSKTLASICHLGPRRRAENQEQQQQKQRQEQQQQSKMSKVHGSLARAGKVRGQTPKVAKQDKKKKPRGRAHKRMQYNRRFVTAVAGFGKKRGPNSSEK